MKGYRCLCSHVALMAMLVLTPTLASAQAPPPAAAPPQTPAQGWNATLTGLLQLESGSTSLHLFDVGFSMHNVRGKSDYMASANYRWGQTKISKNPLIETTIASRLEAELGQDREFGKYGVLSAKSSYMHDRLMLVSYRFEELIGVGVRLAKGGAKLRIIPDVAYIKERKLRSTVDTGSDLGVGVSQDLSIPLNKMWTFTQEFKYQRHTDRAGDYLFNGTAALTGAITTKLGLQLQYEYDHENLVPPTTQTRYQKIGVGLQLRF